LLDDQHWAASRSVDTHLREQGFETLTSGDMPAVEAHVHEHVQREQVNLASHQIKAAVGSGGFVAFENRSVR